MTSHVGGMLHTPEFRAQFLLQQVATCLGIPAEGVTIQDAVICLTRRHWRVTFELNEGDALIVCRLANTEDGRKVGAVSQFIEMALLQAVKRIP